MSEKNQPPKEVSSEEASQAIELSDLLDKKAREKINLEKIEGLHILNKTKFYYNTNKELREHIASYNGMAILIKQENIKQELNETEVTMFPSLVTLKELKLMKKVNGNIIRKLQPSSLHEYEKMSMMPRIIEYIDNEL